MAASRQSTARRTKQKTSVGLFAIGSAGSWEVSIDETTSGRARWFAQIEGPLAYLRVEIASPEIISDTVRFLAEGVSNSLTLENGKMAQVVLLRDDEFTDRFFLLVETKNGPVSRFTLAGKDLADLVEALREVKEQIDNE